MAERERREFLVVGAGPAGVAAALQAAQAGVDTCIVDLRPNISAAKQLARAGVEVRSNTAAWGIWGRTVATCQSAKTDTRIQAEYVLIATGARQRPVIFPGWRLPGITASDEVRGRVVLAGTGPRLAARAVALHRQGADLRAVVEANAAAWDPASAQYLRRHGVTLRNRYLVVRAEGTHHIERAIVARVDREWRAVPGTEVPFNVDTLILDYGTVACSELSRLSGCTHARRGVDSLVPLHDEWMRTDLPGILVAGDVRGACSPEMAADQGRLAGIAAALGTGRLTSDAAQRLASRVRARLGKLTLEHDRAWAPYPVPQAIFELAQPDTVICHCESVTAAAIQSAVLDNSPDPAPVRGETRAAMGVCQARDCARQIEALIAHAAGVPLTAVSPLSVRPPVLPVPLGAIAERPLELV